jgi:hypothetical protein
MILGVCAPLGVFLLLASRNPSGNRSWGPRSYKMPSTTKQVTLLLNKLNVPAPGSIGPQLVSDIELEGVIVRLNWVAFCSPGSQSTLEEFDP